MKSRKYLFVVTLFIVSFLISACSSKTSLELIDKNVDIVSDKNLVGSIEITEGDKKGKELVPTALYYEFTLENTGDTTIGKPDIEKGIELKIEPKEKLKSVSEDVVGFNIFNPEDNIDTGLGYGTTYATVLEPDEKGYSTIHFDLGVSEENPDVPILVPSEEKLAELKDHAFEAFLVVTVEEEEIARFDLEEIEN